MRLGFRRVPVDLIAAAAVTLSVAILVLLGVGGPLQYGLALILVFFVPGYALVAALFPRDGEVDWIRRCALAAGLSIASVALLGLLLNATSAGLSLPSALASLVLLSFTATTVAAVRRLQVPDGERLRLLLDLTVPHRRDLSRADKVLTVAVAIALVSGVGVVALGLAHPPAPDRYTELYLLDPAGGLLNYPLALNASQQGIVLVDVHNVEGATVNYTILVVLMGLETVYNATTRTNETVVANATFLDSFPMDVASGATGSRSYPFAIAVPGQYLVEFRLWMGTPQGGPYRYVDLHVEVS